MSPLDSRQTPCYSTPMANGHGGRRPGAGRPRAPSTVAARVAVRVPAELAEQVGDACAARGVSLSAAVRDALRLWLEDAQLAAARKTMVRAAQDLGVLGLEDPEARMDLVRRDLEAALPSRIGPDGRVIPD